MRGTTRDMCCSAEKGRELVDQNRKLRVGLLSTQGIRGGANQFTLRRVLEHGFIFWALSDRNWSLDGATVHISMIAFTGEPTEECYLDEVLVERIFADLSGLVDTTTAVRLRENEQICFEGAKKHGAFDMPETIAKKMLSVPVNPHGKPNSEVIRPWVNALDITRRPRNMYIVDFGTSMSAADAALYELPFEYVKEHVYPKRQNNRRETRKTRWWLHGETNPGMRVALAPLPRYIITPRVSKHRLFAWQGAGTLPDSATCVFARSDDYFIGVLHSLAHELWARKMGTQLREVESGFRYTPKSTFDTFPFPWPPGTEPTEEEDARVHAIADAARELVRLRDAWLNPPDASEADLKARTLTNLYNQRPEWLANAHRLLDEAVFAAYGWPSGLSKQEILARLLALNHERACAR